MRLSVSVPVLKRRARLLSRTLEIPLHEALDRIAREQGFRTWGHLSASAATMHRARDLFAQLELGDLVLLASRPRQGKTTLGLELIAEATTRGRGAVFFTLDFTEAEVLDRLSATPFTHASTASRLRIDTSEEISGAYVIQQLADVERGTLVVVDYLQLLDQRRHSPALLDQVSALRAFTLERGLITVCLSQISRSFEQSLRELPTLSDVRLPNPLDLGLFTKACFLHEGRMRVDRLF